MPWDFRKPSIWIRASPEDFAELWFGDASSPEFFQRERFEGAARQVPCPGHAADQFIRDLKGDFHGITLTRPSNRVKYHEERDFLVNNLAVKPKSKITAAEVQSRREAMCQAAAHNRIEGQFPTPEGSAIFEAFIRGDIERHEILPRLNAIHRHS
jgi:hypothetical protein